MTPGPDGSGTPIPINPPPAPNSPLPLGQGTFLNGVPVGYKLKGVVAVVYYPNGNPPYEVGLQVITDPPLPGVWIKITNPPGIVRLPDSWVPPTFIPPAK